VVQDQRADDAVGDGVLDGELVGEPIAPVDVLGAGLAAGASEDLMVPVDANDRRGRAGVHVFSRYAASRAMRLAPGREGAETAAPPLMASTSRLVETRRPPRGTRSTRTDPAAVIGAARMLWVELGISVAVLVGFGVVALVGRTQEDDRE